MDKLNSAKGNGLGFGVGCMDAEDLKGKTKVARPGLGKCLKWLCWVKGRTDISYL